MSSTFCNLRDVGGLPLVDGGVVASGVLYRGDAPVIGDDLPDLRPWPPRTVIDLRAPDERDAMQAPAPWPDGTELLEVALLGKLNPIGIMTDNPVWGDGELGRLYREMLADTAGVVRVVSAVATGAPPVFIHCSGGKDRTSLLVGLILDAVGVPFDVLVREHLASNPTLPALNVRVERAIGHELPAPIHSVDEDSFRFGAALWRDHPGGAQGWLLDHGLPARELTALSSRLTGRTG